MNESQPRRKVTRMRGYREMDAWELIAALLDSSDRELLAQAMGKHYSVVCSWAQRPPLNADDQASGKFSGLHRLLEMVNGLEKLRWSPQLRELKQFLNAKIDAAIERIDGQRESRSQEWNRQAAVVVLQEDFVNLLKPLLSTDIETAIIKAEELQHTVELVLSELRAEQKAAA